MFVIEKSYFVELNFTAPGASGKRYYFQDIPQLRGVKTCAIEAICADELTTSPNGKTMVSLANSKYCMLTLAVNDTEVVYQLPVYSLFTNEQGGILKQFKGLNINLVKSYVTTTGTGPGANESLGFVFYYK